MKDLWIKVSTKLTQRAINQIPGRALVETNKRIGFRLLTKGGQTGVVNFAKIVPVVGGVVGGTIDAVMCQKGGGRGKEVVPAAGGNGGRGGGRAERGAIHSAR